MFIIETLKDTTNNSKIKLPVTQVINDYFTAGKMKCGSLALQ